MASLTSSGLNAGYVEQLLEQYRDNPEAVDPAWRELFERADEAVARAGFADCSRTPYTDVDRRSTGTEPPSSRRSRDRAST